MMTRWTVLAATIGLLIAIGAVYGQVLGHGFVSIDDRDYILDNRPIRGGLGIDGIRWAFTTFHADNWHPLTWLSHMLDVTLFGFSPGGHHATNLALHAANTLVLLWLLGRGTGAWWPSLAVAALFALHPVNVESVAWVSERKNLLSTLFWLLAAGAYGRWTTTRRARDYAATGGLFALALLAKPMPVTFPLGLLCLDVWPLRRLDTGGGPWWPRMRPLIVEKLPLIPLSVAAAIVTLIAQSRGGAVRTLAESPLPMRLGNAAIAYAGYLRTMLWPKDLAFFYPFTASRISAGAVLLSLAILAAVTAAALLLARRAPYVAAGWGWYLVALLPVIGIVHVGSQSMADRYAYVPLIGIFAAVAWGCADLAPLLGRARPLLPAAALAVAVVLGILSGGQARLWRTTADVLSQVDRLPMADRDPGEIAAIVRKGLDETIDRARRNPSPAAAMNVALAMLRLNRPDEAEPWLVETLRMDPGHAEARGTLGELLLSRGEVGRAVAELSRSVEAMPGYGEGHALLGRALIRSGRPGEAEGHLRKAIELAPDDAASMSNLGALLAQEGRLDEAVGLFRRSIETRADYAPARFNLGRALWQEGKRDEAEAQLREAARLDPVSFASPVSDMLAGGS